MTMMVMTNGLWTLRALLFVVLFSTLVLVSVGCASGTPPEEEWNRTYGGTGVDAAYSVQQTSDGGYIIAGETRSYGAGKSDIWLVKTDSSGNEQWNRTFGGTGRDWANSVQQTADGGYIIAGGGGEDIWLVKTDSSGNEQWNRTFGGTGFDNANSIQQTADGGYIIAGVGGEDIWLVKTDSSGNEQWNRTFGGTAWDEAYSVQQTADGGYILAGCTDSHSVDFRDIWLVKTDSSGNEQWNRTFGKAAFDEAYLVHQTSDGGYTIAGISGAGVGYWLVKTDSNGNEQWNKTFGGTDYSHAVQQTSDDGYIIAGEARLYDADWHNDFWLVKTDSNGNEQWNKTFEGTGVGVAYSVQQTSDGGYIIAGTSYGAGKPDFWLIKIERGPIESDGEITTPEGPIEEDKRISGFEAIFAIVGLLAMVYLSRRRS